MLVTPSGIVILSRLLHPLKALSPMLVTLLGISILVKLLHPLKASLPMLVNWIPSVNVTLVRIRPRYRRRRK